MQKVYLGLGSNTGFNGMTPKEILEKACCELETVMKNVKLSSLYKTKPMYVENQDDFLNMVVCGDVEDDEDPFVFLKKINGIEAKFGRDRNKEIRFGPRPLDIDIEIFGEKKISSDVLQIPHVRIHERAFVLCPLVEILEKNADDLLKKQYSDYLSKLDISDIEKIN